MSETKYQLARQHEAEVLAQAQAFDREVASVLDGRFFTEIHQYGEGLGYSATVWVCSHERGMLLPVLDRNALDNLLFFVEGMKAPSNTELEEMAQESK